MSTTIKHSNIAFIKYWGLRDPEFFIPLNNSISMTLKNCQTTTDIVLGGKKDQIFINNNLIDPYSSEPKDRLIYTHLERIRILADSSQKITVNSHNNFPTKTGIASSASGLAALTVAVCKTLGIIEQDWINLSRLTRLGGSVSAIRSLKEGFNEAVVAQDDCYAKQLFPIEHWDLNDVIAIIDQAPKKIGSLEGHLLANKNPFMKARLSELPDRLKACRQALKEKSLSKLGPLIEADCLSMYSIMITSNPPLIYWNDSSWRIIEAVTKWRESGQVEAYFTLDAGANVHIITENPSLVVLLLEPMVKSIILN